MQLNFHTFKAAGFWDKIGAAVSWICAAHCLALPLLISSFPLLGLSFLDNLSGVTLPSTPGDAPQNLGTILTGAGILALLMPFIGGAIGGALGARTGRRRP